MLVTPNGSWTQWSELYSKVRLRWFLYATKQLQQRENIQYLLPKRIHYKEQLLTNANSNVQDNPPSGKEETISSCSSCSLKT